MAKRSEQARDDRGVWDIGGGKLDVHELVEVALEREILEEYCTPVLDKQFLGYRDVHRTNPEGQSTHWVALDFAVLVDPAVVTIGEPHKFTDLKWFTLDSIPADSELHSQLPTFFKDHRAELDQIMHTKEL